MTDLFKIEDSICQSVQTIREHWAALLVPSYGSGAGDGSQSSDVVNGLDRRVSLAHEVTLALNGWARIVVEDRGTKNYVPLGHDTLGLCDFLERHAQWMSWHEAGQDCADELAGWASKVRLAVVRPVKDWITIGECPLVVKVDGTDVEAFCSGEIRAYPGKDPTCQDCGTEAVWSWWEKHLDPDASDLVSSDELVVLLYRAFGTPVKPTTIRQWVSRGVIEATLCVLATRRMMFNREDVIRRLAERHDAA